MIVRFIIEEEGYRIKRYLVKKGIPDHVFKEIRSGNGQYLVNDQIVDNHFLLHKGDLLEVVMPASDQGENIVSTLGDFEIVYEDSYLLIINKEPNIATIPTKEHFTNSLANYVMSYYKRNGILANIHFVSRLDAPTSGLIMLAKTSYMTTLLQNTNITKKYLLETSNIVEPSDGIIELGIEKDPTSVIKRYTTTDFINSKTVYKTLYQENNHSFIEALLCTGKTHQLRLHFLSKNAPIVGDMLYGEETEDGILHLHSYYLEFVHPITKETLSFTTYPSWYKEKC
ncbi:MAG: RluA family pseudouridine synthase [Bacilli bacterium]|nr:RluA family pseudouridine synthase [Bacilli bacterium]